MNRFRAAILAATVLAAPAKAENTVVADAIVGFVRPAYGELHAVSSRLSSEMDALCADPSSDKVTAAQSAFVTVVNVWSAVEIIRFGPVTEESRLERILFWPDRKSIGLKQVQAALAEKDESVTDPARMKGKSVAMQGLGALEFILFGKGNESLDIAEGAHRCAYGRAVAANIELVTKDIEKAWQDPDGFARRWSSPGADNPLYRTDQEAMTELFNVFVHGLEMVRDVRLNGFLAVDHGGDKPKQAIYWRSGATVASLAGNLRGMQRLFETARVAGLLPQDMAWIAQSIDFEFKTAATLFDKSAVPIRDVLADERRSGLPAIRLITLHLSELFGINMAGALGLSAGFSSLDGD